MQFSSGTTFFFFASAPFWPFPDTSQTCLHRSGRRGTAKAVFMLIRHCGAIVEHILPQNYVKH